MANIELRPGPIIRSLPLVSGQTIANWNTAESTILTIGESGVTYWATLCVVNIGSLTVGADITTRGYMIVNGTEEFLGSDISTVGTDPNVFWPGGLWFFAIHEAIRLTAQSDTPADNGLAIKYEYILERH